MYIRKHWLKPKLIKLRLVSFSVFSVFWSFFVFQSILRVSCFWIRVSFRFFCCLVFLSTPDKIRVDNNGNRCGAIESGRGVPLAYLAHIMGSRGEIEMTQLTPTYETTWYFTSRDYKKNWRNNWSLMDLIRPTRKPMLPIWGLWAIFDQNDFKNHGPE